MLICFDGFDEIGGTNSVCFAGAGAGAGAGTGSGALSANCLSNVSIFCPDVVAIVGAGGAGAGARGAGAGATATATATARGSAATAAVFRSIMGLLLSEFGS